MLEGTQLVSEACDDEEASVNGARNILCGRGHLAVGLNIPAQLRRAPL